MSENNEVTRKEFEEMKAQIKENNLMLKRNVINIRYYYEWY